MTAPKSFMEKTETAVPNWFVLDADGQVVGRIATKIATVLMGKHKPTYTPHVDCGDCVVVLNVDLVRFSGHPVAHPHNPYFTDKFGKKVYRRYTGYPSGQRLETAADRLDRRPELILHDAVRRMLPKNKLGRKMLKKLKLYTGVEHPHQAQQPAAFPEYLLNS